MRSSLMETVASSCVVGQTSVRLGIQASGRGRHDKELVSSFRGPQLPSASRLAKDQLRRHGRRKGKVAANIASSNLSLEKGWEGATGQSVSAQSFFAGRETLVAGHVNTSHRGARVVCQSLKMEDKYKSLKARRLLKEMEELRDRGYDRNGKSTPWGGAKKKAAKGAGNEGKKKSEMDGDHNGIAPWEKRMRINYGDDVEEQEYGLDYWEDDAKNVAAKRGLAREFVQRGGGTYGGQFAREVRGGKRTIIDTADIAKLVAERPGTRTQLAGGVAGYYEQFDPELLEKGSALFQDAAEVQQRMGWYLESIGVDVHALDLSKVPGTGEEQEEKVEYLKTLGLAQEDVADIIRRWPQLLRLSLRKNMKPVVKYLESDWIAFKDTQLEALLSKYPQILYHSIELTLQPRILFLRGVGLTRSQSRDVLLKCPSLFDTRIERFPSTSLAYLAAIGVEAADMWKVACGCPEILVRGVNQFMKPRYEALQLHLALPEDETRRALLQTPELLLIDDVKQLTDELTAELHRWGVVAETPSRESSLKASEEDAAGAPPSAKDESAHDGAGSTGRGGEFAEGGSLREGQRGAEQVGPGATEAAASGLVESAPREAESTAGVGSPEDLGKRLPDIGRIVALYGHHLHERGLAATVNGALGPLQEQLGLGADELRSVLCEYPAILELEPQQITGKIEALQAAGLSADDIRRMVVADPDWLGVDLEGAFVPKLDYLQAEMGRSARELVDFPNFLCYSLPDRISSRHQKVQECMKTLPLRSLIGCRWATFNTAVNSNDWDYEVDKVDLAEEAWTLERAYERQRWEPAKIGAGPVGGLI